MKDKIKIGLGSYLSLLAISVNVLNIKEILNLENKSEASCFTFYFTTLFCSYI